MGEHHITAILPCNDLDASVAFYTLLGLTLEFAVSDPDGVLVRVGRIAG